MRLTPRYRITPPPGACLPCYPFRWEGAARDVRYLWAPTQGDMSPRRHEPYSLGRGSSVTTTSVVE